MARSGDHIETRIGLRGGQEVRQQLEQLGRAGETALRQIGGAIGDSSNAFARLSSGADEVRRHMDQLALAGRNTGNSIRASLLSAISGVNNFAAGANAANASSGQLRFALQNLSFQVNDVATSLASGSDPMRVFAQQGGQIIQVFQQGGGLRAVIGAAATAIGAMITPMTLAAAGAVALAAGLALIAARAATSQASARQFDVILKGLGKSSQGTGKELEEAAKQLRDVGLTANEARTALSQALREGIKPTEAQRIVRIGTDLNTVLGEGSMERFISAAAQGGEPLSKFAEQLGILPKGATEAQKALRELGETTTKSNDAINDVLRRRGQSIVDEQRSKAQQITDLTRERGTAQQEIELATSRRIQEINRDTNRSIIDILNQRNKENAQKLAEFNKQVQEAAQKAVGDQSLIGQIERRVKGSFRAALGPFREAVLDMSIAWNKLLDAMANSAVFQSVVAGLQEAAKALGGLFKVAAAEPEFTAAIVAAGAAVIGLGISILALKLAVAGVSAVAAGLSAVFSGGLLFGLTALLSPFALLTAAVLAVFVAFLDWKKLLDGSTWTDFKNVLSEGLGVYKAFGAYLTDTFVGAWNAATDAIKSTWDGAFNWVINGIGTLIGWFDALWKKVQEVAQAIGSVFGGGVNFGGGGNIAQNAGGGFVRGAGTGTSDSILSWLSNGEFINTARAVRYWGTGVFEALNRLQNPFKGFALGGLVDAINTPMVPRGRGFAAGGLVAAGAGGGAPVHLHLDGRSFALRGEQDVVDALTKSARRAKTLSMGRKPSSVG